MNQHILKLYLILNLLFVSNISRSATNDFLPVPTKNTIRHTYFTLSYNEKNEQANWVYYVLTDDMVNSNIAERGNHFKVDLKVPTGSARTSDYTNSGYDRGHLCPAGDMGFDAKAMSESFLMSNISPQKPEFNRGIWKDLETTVRNWAKEKDSIIVITGPVFNNDTATIGKEKVTVPGYFFKLVYEIADKPRMIAFIMPNEKSNRPIEDYVVTIDQLERQTGFDYFSQLTDSLENILESNVDLSGWFDINNGIQEPVFQKKSTIVNKKSDLKFYIILISVILFVAVFVAFIGKRRS
jgi:endonuclease G, mitochondrial